MGRQVALLSAKSVVIREICVRILGLGRVGRGRAGHGPYAVGLGSRGQAVGFSEECRIPWWNTADISDAHPPAASVGESPHAKPERFDIMNRLEAKAVTGSAAFQPGVVVRNRWMISTVCGLLLGASGCGGNASGPPENPSAPPATVSAPPPTVPVRRDPAANNAGQPPAPKPVAAAPRSKSDDGPPEQMFDLADDTHNFTLATQTPLSQLFFVNAASPEGSTLSVEQPGLDGPSTVRSLPAGFEAILREGYTETGWPRRIRGEVDGKEMACVPSGLFTQGSQNGTPDAAPAHAMSLDTYYIDVTEVTIGEYAKFKAALTGKDGGPTTPVPLNGDPRLPVVKLSWKDASNYAKWAKKDLPTEAEWEKAGRGPEAGIYPWGNDRVIWHTARALGQITPVGTYPHDRSRYGVMDLSGNVREWCTDWYHNAAYAEAKSKDGSPAHNWTGPKKASNGERVVKGSVDRWELWARGSHSMTKPAADIGFRGVLRCGAEAPKE